MDWTSLLVSWGPMLMLLAVWFIISRAHGMRAKAPSGRSLLELYEAQLEEMKRNAALMERIAVALESKAK